MGLSYEEKELIGFTCLIDRSRSIKARGKIGENKWRFLQAEHYSKNPSRVSASCCALRCREQTNSRHGTIRTTQGNGLADVFRMWKLLMAEEETAAITCPVRPINLLESVLACSQGLECKRRPRVSVDWLMGWSNDNWGSQGRKGRSSLQEGWRLWSGLHFRGFNSRGKLISTGWILIARQSVEDRVVTISTFDSLQMKLVKTVRYM